jgi:hypothetical protein
LVGCLPSKSRKGNAAPSTFDFFLRYGRIFEEKPLR